MVCVIVYSFKINEKSIYGLCQVTILIHLKIYFMKSNTTNPNDTNNYTPNIDFSTKIDFTPNIDLSTNIDFSDNIDYNDGSCYNRKLRKNDQERQAQQYRLIGESMKAARLKRLFSIKELASRAKVDRSTIYHIEKGKSTISLFSFLNVLKALDLFEDVMRFIDNDIQGNIIFKRKMMIKENTKSYKL